MIIIESTPYISQHSYLSYNLNLLQVSFFHIGLGILKSTAILGYCIYKRREFLADSKLIVFA